MLRQRVTKPFHNGKADKKEEKMDKEQLIALNLELAATLEDMINRVGIPMDETTWPATEIAEGLVMETRKFMDAEQPTRLHSVA